MPGAPHTWAGRPRDGPEGGGEVAGAPAGDTGMSQGTHPLLLVWLILVDLLLMAQLLLIWAGAAAADGFCILCKFNSVILLLFCLTWG